ncbi:hypothetical protein CCP4SC76_2000005 [Gammaproteobacteria bacterium]
MAFGSNLAGFQEGRDWRVAPLETWGINYCELPKVLPTALQQTGQSSRTQNHIHHHKNQEKTCQQNWAFAPD